MCMSTSQLWPFCYQYNLIKCQCMFSIYACNTVEMTTTIHSPISSQASHTHTTSIFNTARSGISLEGMAPVARWLQQSCHWLHRNRSNLPLGKVLLAFVCGIHSKCCSLHTVDKWLQQISTEVHLTWHLAMGNGRMWAPARRSHSGDSDILSQLQRFVA